MAAEIELFLGRGEEAGNKRNGIRLARLRSSVVVFVRTEKSNDGRYGFVRSANGSEKVTRRG